MTQDERKRRAAQVGVLYSLRDRLNYWDPEDNIYNLAYVARFLLVIDEDDGTYSVCVEFCHTVDEVVSYFDNLDCNDLKFVAVHDLESDDYMTSLPVKLQVVMRDVSDGKSSITRTTRGRTHAR